MESLGAHKVKKARRGGAKAERGSSGAGAGVCEHIRENNGGRGGEGRGEGVEGFVNIII